MTTCDILLSRTYSPLNNSSSFSHSAFFPLSLPTFLFSFFLTLLAASRISLFHPAFPFSLYPPHGLGLLPPFLLLTRKSRVSECGREGGRQKRGNGIRRISASIKQELRDRPRHIPTRTICIYLDESYKSRLLSTVPWHVRQGVRKVST